MKLTLTTDAGDVLDEMDVTPDEWREEIARHPHSLIATLEPGRAALDDAESEECPGHYDDDHTLTSGAGIGEPTFCDGTCLR